jgi:hypothetical protein
VSFDASARSMDTLTSSSLGRAMPVAELPFDVVEAKLAAPLTRRGTVAKADVIARLCASLSPFATVVAPAAVHDDALLEVLAVEGGAFATSVMDEWTAALVRVAATIAVDAAPSSFQHTVALALAAGATSDQIVASLEAVTPVTGAARVVPMRRPKLALALGYDVDAALERLDP